MRGKPMFCFWDTVFNDWSVFWNGLCDVWQRNEEVMPVLFLTQPNT